ncbi:hypothetical protein DSECCO2_318490 [anaerobic digester metagenome]
MSGLSSPTSSRAAFIASGSREHSTNGNLEFLSFAAAFANVSLSSDAFLSAIAFKVRTSPVLSNSVSSIVLTLASKAVSSMLSATSMTIGVGL